MSCSAIRLCEKNRAGSNIGLPRGHRHAECDPQFSSRQLRTSGAMRRRRIGVRRRRCDHAAAANLDQFIHGTRPVHDERCIAVPGSLAGGGEMINASVAAQITGIDLRADVCFPLSSRQRVTSLMVFHRFGTQSWSPTIVNSSCSCASGAPRRCASAAMTSGRRFTVDARGQLGFAFLLCDDGRRRRIDDQRWSSKYGSQFTDTPADESCYLREITAFFVQSSPPGKGSRKIVALIVARTRLSDASHDGR